MKRSLQTCVVKDVLYNILNLIQGEVVFWHLPLVAMNPHSWSVGDVALLQVLVALDANVVKEEKGTLAYTLTMVVEKGRCYLSLRRTCAMVTLQDGGLETAGHNLPHDEHIQFIMRHLGHCTSNGEEVVCRKEPATRGLLGANITTTATLYKGLHQVILLCIYIPHGHSDVADVGECPTPNAG